MGKRRRGHYVKSTHVQLDDDFELVAKKSSRISSSRQEDEERRVEERRKKLESEFAKLMLTFIRFDQFCRLAREA